MEEKIYIVEALHELPILHDRINKNKEKLQEYSSGVSNITPVFGTEQEQRNYVAALMQSTKALLERYLWLKRCIAYTNAMSKVEICKRAYSIVELISLRQDMGELCPQSTTVCRSAPANACTQSSRREQLSRPVRPTAAKRRS